MKITPLPSHIGLGFTSPEKLDLVGYKYQQVGLFHNYFFTPDFHDWPEEIKPGKEIIDGISPNLNKKLHGGHLKNLAIAAAVKNICCKEAVAMLGASQGIIPDAEKELYQWYELAGYHPEIYLDIDLPAPKQVLTDGTKGEKECDPDYTGCKMYNGVVIYKSDGKPTYAAHDLSFASMIGPTIYLTGAEQKVHFKSLGLGDKHHPIGLLLGEDGKKMKSTIKKDGEENNAFSAEELFNLVKKTLIDFSAKSGKTLPDPDKLAWNILAYNFNSSAKSKDTKFSLSQWINPDSPGMYVSYTCARLNSVLKKAGPGKMESISDDDLLILSWCSYFNHYYNQAQNKVEPHYIAKYLHDFCKVISTIYHKAKIVGGSPTTIYCLHKALNKLQYGMALLSMFPLTSI